MVLKVAVEQCIDDEHEMPAAANSWFEGSDPLVQRGGILYAMA
ncbi:MAG: hypothetical protein U0905_09755 [Pirellulales bacterium]